MKDLKRFMIALLVVLGLVGGGVGLLSLGNASGSLILLVLGLLLVVLGLGLALILYFFVDAGSLF